MATLEAVAPYVEQLFDDSEVQKQLSRAAANLRGAKGRANRAKSKRQALADPKLRRRLLDGGRAAYAAGVAIKRGPEVQQRRSRRGRLLGAGALAAGGYVAYSAPARAKLLGLIGKAGGEPAPTP